MAKHARNHIVTRAHIDLFARSGLVACHLRNGSVQNLPPSEVAVRKDFYVIKDGLGTRDTSLEEAMGPAEGAAVEVLRTVPTTWPLSQERRFTVVEYLALQCLRTPAFKAWHVSKSHELLSGVAADQRWGDLSDEEREATAEFLTSDRYRHETMMRLLSRVCTLVGSMHWSLLRSSAPRICISDHPVVCVPLVVGRFRPFQAVPDEGFANVIEMRFPVDPHHALLLTWRDVPEEEQGPISLPRDLLRDLNASVVGQAENQWFHRPGATPPHSSRVQEPISTRLFTDYGARTAESSGRRASALESVQEMAAAGQISRTMHITRVQRTAV